MAKYITSSLVILAIVENIQYVTKTHTKQKKKHRYTQLAVYENKLLQ